MEIKNYIFRQYDMRGVYPTDINEVVAYVTGAFLPAHLNLKKPRVLVTYDARKSSQALMRALVYGLTQAGARVVCGGLSTTPMHMFLVAKYKYDLGIMVTASHNPAEFNGFKINLKGARPFYGERLQAFSAIIMKQKIEYPSEAIETLEITERSYLSSYVDFIVQHLPKGISKKRVLIDPSHGVAGMVLKEVVKRKRLTNWIFTADTMDGDFSVHGPNPLMPDVLFKFRRAVRKYKADVGVIFDVDADRVFFILSGDKGYVPSSVVGFLLARQYVKQIPRAKILYEVRAGTLLRDELLRAGARPTLVHVGHPYFKDGIRNEKAPFGFELSGHYYFKEFFCVDSGIFAFTKFLGAVLKEKNGFKKELSMFAKKPHSPEINYIVKDKVNTMKRVETLLGEGNKVSYFDGLSIEAKDFYVNIRPSGTEDLIRLNVEAKDERMLRKIIKNIEGLIGTI
ncbi:MAG: hypothetical protein AAB611_03755 [Patescibacteria group bacterium]